MEDEDRKIERCQWEKEEWGAGILDKGDGCGSGKKKWGGGTTVKLIKIEGLHGVEH